jgi:hypothetical protein
MSARCRASRKDDEAIVQILAALNKVPKQLLAGEGAMPTP